MAYVHPAWLEYQSQRFTRPDGDRYLRHDAERYLKPLPFDHKAFIDEYRAAKAAEAARSAPVTNAFDDPEVRRLIAEIKLDLLRLQYWCKAYNPNQPRVPGGNPDGGQWTRLAGPNPGGGPPRYGLYFPGATYRQLTQLNDAIARTQRALEGIRRYDQNWQPRTTSASTTSFEGAVRRAEARAIEAEARLQQLRSGIGGNFGPPLQSPPPRFGTLIPSSRPFDGPAWMYAYRAANNMPDLFGHPSWPFDKGTVAVAEIDGKIHFGVNSEAPGYDQRIDGGDAFDFRKTLIEKYPDVIMRTDNIGGIPNDSLYHAESTILLRAAREHGGTLAGRTIEVQTDREMCSTSCLKVLPKLGMELGNPTVIFVGPLGRRRVMRETANGIDEVDMRKLTYFDTHWGDGWPDPNRLERYFLAPPGKQWVFVSRTADGSLIGEGADGTEHLQESKGRIDIQLQIWGLPGFGSLLIWSKWGGGLKLIYSSKGDLSRLKEIVRSFHRTPLPVGLFISFESAWNAVKEFMETDGALPKSIEWIANHELPPNTFPDP